MLRYLLRGTATGPGEKTLGFTRAWHVRLLDFDQCEQSVLVVAIGPESFKSMCQARPIMLASLGSGGTLRPVKYPGNFSILIAYEDEVALYNMIWFDDGALVRYLERARTWIESVDGKKNTVHLTSAQAGQHGDR